MFTSRHIKRNDFNYEQMEEINKGYNNGVNFRVYLNPKISHTNMRIIRIYLEHGINIMGKHYEDIFGENIDKSVIAEVKRISFEMRYAIDHGMDCLCKHSIVDIDTTLNFDPTSDSFNESQHSEINAALKAGINTNILFRNDVPLSGMDMHQTRIRYMRSLKKAIAE